MSRERLRPCPNTSCRRPDLVGVVVEPIDHSTRFFVACKSCGLRGPEHWMAFANSARAEGKARARELWDALPRAIDSDPAESVAHHPV
ncbi:MAG: hypothetical protein AAFP86_07220 [Planctomycetota bacterium]